MNNIAVFFAGAFLCNCIRHLASGLQGISFPTPFSRPRGVGDSSPLVNVLWGGFNFLAGALLLAAYPVAIGFNAGFLSSLLGALALGVYLSLHFGKVRQKRDRS